MRTAQVNASVLTHIVAGGGLVAVAMNCLNRSVPHALPSNPSFERTPQTAFAAAPLAGCRTTP